MPAASLGLLGAVTATSAGTTLVVPNSTGAIIPAGTFIHITGTWDNIASVTAPTITCSTIGGATATVNHATAVGSGITTTAGSGVWHSCVRALTTADIAIGGTIATLTSNQSAVKRAAHAHGASGATAALHGAVPQTGVSTTGAPSAGTSALAGDLTIGSVSFENNAQMTGTAGTSGGTWSPIVGTFTTGGQAGTNVGTGSQVKVVNGSTSQFMDPTGGVADCIACIYSVVPAPEPAVTAAAYRFYADGPEPGTLADGYDETNLNASLSTFTANDRHGQSFLGDGGNLVRAGFWLSKTGTPPGSHTAVLYAHTGAYGAGGTGTGSPLATSSPRLATSLSTTAQWEDFTFDGTFQLVAGTAYVILLVPDTTGDISNRTGMSYRGTTGTHAGAKQDLGPAGAWGTQTTADTIFRVYTDSGALAAQNTAPTVEVSSGFPHLALRVRLQSTSVTTLPSTTDWQLQWEKNASGTWASLAGSTVIGYDSTDLTEGQATTNRLGAGTGSFVTGMVSEDGVVTDFGLTANNYTEVLYSIALVGLDLANGDTLRFRVLKNAATTDMTYTQVPTVNVTKTIAAVTAASYQFYADGTESGSTALAAQDTSYTGDVTSGDVNLAVRMRLQSTNIGVISVATDWQLQYEKNASGTWKSVDVPGVNTFDSYLSNNFSVGVPLDTTFPTNGQTFLGNGGRLRRAAFYLRKVGTPDGTIFAELYAHTGTFGSAGSTATGPPLATSITSMVSTDLLTTFENLQFVFDGSVTMESGTPYCIVVRTTNSVSGAVEAGVDGTSPTHPGVDVFYDNSGAGVWSTSPTQDAIFEVSFTPDPTVSPFNSANLTDGAVTTNRLTGGTGSFVAGKVSEDGLVDDLGWTGNDYTEVLYSVTLKQADLANGDTLRFRVLKNAATTDMTYTQVPTVNITTAAGAAVSAGASLAVTATITTTAGVTSPPAVTYVGTGGVQVGTTSLVVTGVSNAAVDDWLMLFVFHKSLTSVVTPAGWIGFDTGSSTAAGTGFVFWKKVTSAGVQADVAFTTIDSSVGSMACFHGADLNDPPFRLNAAGGGSVLVRNFLRKSNLDGTYGMVAPSGTSIAASAGDLALVGHMLGNDTSSDTWTINGVAATEIADGNTQNGSDSSLAWAYRPVTGSETINTATVNVTELSAGTADNFCLVCVLKVATPGAVSADATLAVSATIGAAAVPEYMVGATLAVTATVGAAAVPVHAVGATLAATATIGAAAVPEHLVAANAVAVTATVTAAALPVHAVGAALGVTGTITADATVTTALNSMTVAAATREAVVAGTEDPAQWSDWFAGTAQSITVAFRPQAAGAKDVAAALPITASIAATLDHTVPVATGGLAVTATIAATAALARPLAAAVPVTATITAGALRTVGVAATLPVTATITSAVVPTLAVTANALPVTATVTATALRLAPAAATLAVTATTSAGVLLVVGVGTTVPVTATITSAAALVRPLDATSLVVTSTITAGLLRTVVVGTSLAVTATITTAVTPILVVTANVLPVTATITGDITRTQPIGLTLAITTSLTATAAVQSFAAAAATLDATATISTAATITRPVAAVLAVTATTAADVTITRFAAANALPVTATIGAAAALARPMDAAALAVTATVAAAITRVQPSAAALAVTATLTADALRTAPLDAALPVTATITTSITPTRVVTATAVPVTATITADLTRTQPAAAALAVTAGITADLTRTVGVTATLPVTATLTAGAFRLAPAAASLAVTATTSATVTRTQPLDAALPVTATITAGTTPLTTIGTALPVTATLSATMLRTVGLAAADLPVTATIGAAALRVADIGTTLAVTTTTTATALRVAGLPAALAVTATITADGLVTKPAAATLAATATVTADALVVHPAAAALAVTATTSADLTRTQPVATTLAVTATTTATAALTLPVQAALAVTATITTAATPQIPVQATLPVTATITATALRVAAAAAALPVTATISATAERFAPAAATLAVTATTSATMLRTAGLSAALAVTSTTTAGALRIADIGTTLPVTATVAADLTRTAPAGASLAVTATLTSTLQVDHPVGVTLPVVATLTATMATAAVLAAALPVTATIVAQAETSAGLPALASLSVTVTISADLTRLRPPTMWWNVDHYEPKPVYWWNGSAWVQAYPAVPT